MNLQDHEFDTVVLGFDDKSKETVETLKKEGKRVLYIPIDPQMMITMMAQKRVHTTESNETITHLQIQQHQMQTSFQNTTTYLLQPIVQMYDSETIEEQMNNQEEEVIEMDLHITSEDNTENEIVLQDEVEAEKVAFTFADVDSEETKEKVEEPTETSSPTSEELEEEIEENHDISEEESIDEQEILEEEDKTFSFPIITPLAKESSLIDNRMLGIRRNKYPGLQRNEKNGLSSSMISSYHLFNPIRIEEEEQIEEKQENQNELETNQDEQTTDNMEIESESHIVPKPNFFDDKNNFIFHGPPPINQTTNLEQENIELSKTNSSDNSMDQDEQNEQEIAEQLAQTPLMKQNKLPDMDELLLQSHLEESSSIPEEKTEKKEEVITEATEIQSEDENEDSIDETDKTSAHTLVLNRDIRLRKKFSFHKLHQETTSNPIVKEVNQEKLANDQTDEEQTKKPDVFPLEPFSSRRRNKKSRLFSSLESAIPNPIVQPSSTSKPEKSFSSLIQESLIQPDIEDESIKTTKSDPSANVIPSEEEETNADTIETTSDNLKIDNIEFEEPYGYNSFEDFFPSFSNSNDRKRQEMDKIEKRKIALRGLHNLINNLG
ncbi:hypothetical protein MK805_08685 [Shimazuella sp. AN120528]|uniref:hypothetical protein n=1 Tax=Shimazuella soli TaxID=1892854 RepID=UPI001F0D0A6D|nr:hypothetical protein [Shimazuella soli]MCH5585045.1 hypothetical protein [Shimazuella soli]